jgi:hypothetical protein
METFSLCWRDVSAVEPLRGPTVGLPPNQGMVRLQLLAQTKSQQAMTANVVLAFSTASGFSIGTWLERLRFELREQDVLSTDFILAHANGSPWTSHYF